MFKHLLTTVRMLQTFALRDNFHPRLFVANLPWTVGDTELIQYFSQFGKVQEAKVQYDSVTKKSRSFAFVSFINQPSYESALNAKVHLLEGRLLKIQPATHVEYKKRLNK